jgi:SNW domain-containing protein 1
MATQLSLPAPKRTFNNRPAAAAPPAVSSTTTAAPNPKRVAPSYEDRCRLAVEASKLTADQRKARKMQLFVPRTVQDFDDGGAFPEIHVAQYPHHMGNPHRKQSGAVTVAGSQGSSSRAIVNVEIDEQGDVSYDAIVKGGTNSDKLVYTKLDDVKGGDPVDITLPTEDEEEETRRRTQAALQSLLATKTALDKPSGSAMINAATSQNAEQKTQFIKYKPREDAPGYNPAAATRVIQMVPAQVDPMMPPKHMHIKAPRGPAEDFVPVLHGPPPKLSQEERQSWNIPACISNWKNARGYTIPLDKRLAADGRGLRDETTINSNFATLSESLYVAEQQARQEVRLRAQVQTKLASQERQKREDELRQLAQQARRERGGEVVTAPSTTTASATTTTARDKDDKERVSTVPDDDSNASDGQDDTDDVVAARQRDRLRQERRKERERDLRLEKNMSLKRQKLEADRDVSEKMALGVHTGTGGGLAGDVDARLYNQTAGMDSGFGADDEYNTYSKPLFEGQQAAGSIYRPTRGETEYNADEQYDKLVDGATSKFQPDRGFAGAEGGGPAHRAGPRPAPVQFEKKS